jgi:hypothetical protein
VTAPGPCLPERNWLYGERPPPRTLGDEHRAGGCRDFVELAVRLDENQIWTVVPIMGTKVQRLVTIMSFAIPLIAAPVGVRAQEPNVRDHRAPRWDSRGWERLGETSVEGRNDRDVVHVGRREGAFSKLMLVVEGGDIEMYDVIVTLGGGEQFSPRTRYYFREGTRTNAIDLPGGARGIRDIELRYGGLSGRARVEIWGKAGELAPPPPPAWEPRGWRKLGETRVDGRIDRDIVQVRGRQLFRQLVVNIRGSDLEMYDMVITFRDGSRYQPDLRLVFGEGSRSRIIDLPGDLRAVRSVGFRYGNLSGSGPARVEVWGR